MKEDLPSDIKTMTFPLLAFIVLIILGFLLVKVGLAKFLAQQEQVAGVQKEVQILQQKDTVLKEASYDIGQNANLLSLILPGSDPTAVVISQIKTLAGSGGISSIDSISSRPVPKVGTIPESSVSISVTGPVTEILYFLSNLADITPLVSLQNVSLNEDKIKGNTADIVISSYWSPYPKTFPAALDLVNALSASEKDMISKMSALDLPSFTELQPQSPSSERTNPF